MKHQKRLQWLLHCICGIMGVLSIAIFIPSVRNHIIAVGERFMGKPLNHTLWYGKLAKMECAFLLFNLLVIALCHLPAKRLSSILFPQRTSLDSSSREYPVRIPLLFLFVTALSVLSVCSTCSYLYPYNIWVDSNCFHTVGKSVWSGKVLYRDIYDHKGPLLYIIHSFATLISYRTFLGVFVYEVIAATAFLFYLYKTATLFVTRNVLFLLPIMAAVIYGSPNFVFGDSAEEFCLPLLMYPLYLSARHVVERTDFRPRELIVTGILAGCVLWIKFSLLGFFLGWAVIPVISYTKRKNYMGIGLASVMVIFGVVLATVPWLVYFGVHGAIGDWLSGYIVDNIFLYTIKRKAIVLPFAMANSMLSSAFRNPIVFFMLFVSLVTAFLSPDRRLGISIALQFGCSFLLAFSGGQVHQYASFIFAPFTVYALIPMAWVCQHGTAAIRDRRMKHILQCGIFPCAVVLAFALSPNTRLLSIPRESYPQYKITEYIWRYESPSLLNYSCLDLGIYTTTGIVPQAKFHCALNIRKPEIAEEQDAIVNQGQCDFIVTSKPFESPLYALVLYDQLPNPTEKGMKNYYLYKNRLLH